MTTQTATRYALTALAGATALLATAGAQAAIVTSGPTSFNSLNPTATQTLLPVYAGSNIAVDVEAREKVQISTINGANGRVMKAAAGDVIGSASLFTDASVDVVKADGSSGFGDGYYGFSEEIADTGGGVRYGWINISTELHTVPTDLSSYFTGSFTSAYNDVLNASITIPGGVGPSTPANDVPEPASLALLAAGLGGVLATRRRRAAAVAA